MREQNDCLNNIVNAERRGKRQVLIRPSSKVVVKFLSVMQRHGGLSFFPLVPFVFRPPLSLASFRLALYSVNPSSLYLFFCVIPFLCLHPTTTTPRRDNYDWRDSLPRVSRFNAPEYRFLKSLITKQRVSALSRETSSQRRLHPFLFLLLPSEVISSPSSHSLYSLPPTLSSTHPHSTSRAHANPPSSGYIGEFEIIDDHRAGKIVIQLNGRLNKTGVISPRFNIQHNQIESWVNLLLPARGFGIIILVSLFSMRGSGLLEVWMGLFSPDRVYPSWGSVLSALCASLHS